MAKKSTKQTVVEIPVVTTPEFIANAMQLRKAIEFQYVDRQGVISRRVVVPIKFVGVNVKTASLLKDDAQGLQGSSRTFAVARITDVKFYVPTEAERPVAELGWARVRGMFRALDAAQATSKAAAEKREQRKAELFQAAFEANKALRAQIEAEIRN